MTSTNQTKTPPAISPSPSCRLPSGRETKTTPAVCAHDSVPPSPSPANPPLARPRPPDRSRAEQTSRASPTNPTAPHHPTTTTATRSRERTPPRHRERFELASRRASAPGHRRSLYQFVRGLTPSGSPEFVRTHDWQIDRAVSSPRTATDAPETPSTSRSGDATGRSPRSPSARTTRTSSSKCSARPFARSRVPRHVSALRQREFETRAAAPSLAVRSTTIAPACIRRQPASHREQSSVASTTRSPVLATRSCRPASTPSASRHAGSPANPPLRAVASRIAPATCQSRSCPIPVANRSSPKTSDRSMQTRFAANSQHSGDDANRVGERIPSQVRDEHLCRSGGSCRRCESLRSR